MPLMALAACGGDDPTPEAEDSASGAEVNAAVDMAETQANVANAAAGDIPAGEDSKAGTTAGVAGGAAGAQRPTTVDPATGERLQTPAQ